MRLIFLSEHWKFNEDSKNAKKKKKKKKKKKMQQKVYGFLDNLIRIGTGKFSLLLREYA